LSHSGESIATSRHGLKIHFDPTLRAPPGN
jgi:hypothetical protein